MCGVGDTLSWDTTAEPTVIVSGCLALWTMTGPNWKQCCTTASVCGRQPAALISIIFIFFFFFNIQFQWQQQLSIKLQYQGQNPTGLSSHKTTFLHLALCTSKVHAAFGQRTEQSWPASTKWVQPVGFWKHPVSPQPPRNAPWQQPAPTAHPAQLEAAPSTPQNPPR